MSIQSLFTPRGVAVVGSTSEGKLGYELIRQIRDGGFREVYAVNPKAQGVFEVPGYDAVASIAGPVDMVVIVSPTTTVSDVLRDCGRAGVSAAVIITAGFSETGNDAGEAEIQEVARACGIRFVGPNCAGLVNTGYHLYPTLETPPPAGGVSLIAQSGAVGGVVLAWAKEFGLGISKFVSYGNGADLNELDLLRYMAEDPETQVVALYIESVTDGRDFMQAVHACAQRKPVVVIKAGRTASGQRATLSHTGSMAGADAVYEAALKQSGGLRVHTIEELFDLCKGFVHFPPPPLSPPQRGGSKRGVEGGRVAIVTNSGGPGVLAADWAEEVGLDVAEPSSEVKARLSEFLPAHCALKNPIDLTVEGTEEGYRRTLEVVLDAYDAVVALNIAPPYLDSVPLARGVCGAARSSPKPVVASFLPRQVVADAIDFLQQEGIPNFATGERAVTTLAHLAQYSATQQRRHAPLVTELAVPMERLVLPPSVPPGGGEAKGGGQILEPEAMLWLQQNGIPVPQFRFVPERSQVAAGCREIGYPVAMKVVSPEILHKSDYGGVILGVGDDVSALEAFDRLKQVAAGKTFRGVIVYPMIRGGQEVLLGLSRDPQFGPVIAFGLGGIYTEIWRDISLRVAPIDQAEAMAMIREIKAIALLEGVRGEAPRDLETLAQVLVKLSQLPFRFPEIGEIDLNPVFLFSEGLVVGDVRIIRRSETKENSYR
jgi:acyl-CoA synthetase (NDP forming)